MTFPMAPVTSPDFCADGWRLYNEYLDRKADGDPQAVTEAWQEWLEHAKACPVCEAE